MKRRSHCKNVTYSTRYSKFNSREIRDYIEEVQYKIKANENASFIAQQASIYANKAYIKAQQSIETYYAIKKANIITHNAIQSARFASIEAEQSYSNSIINLYRKQIDYLYNAIETLTKPDTPESLVSNETQLTTESTEPKKQRNSIKFIESGKTKQNNSNEPSKRKLSNRSISILSKCIPKKRAKIYDINHKKKTNIGSVIKKLGCLKLVKITNEEQSDEEYSSDEPE